VKVRGTYVKEERGRYETRAEKQEEKMDVPPPKNSPLKKKVTLPSRVGWHVDRLAQLIIFGAEALSQLNYKI
jgi:hypothetical protein